MKSPGGLSLREGADYNDFPPALLPRSRPWTKIKGVQPLYSQEVDQFNYNSNNNNNNNVMKTRDKTKSFCIKITYWIKANVLLLSAHFIFIS